MSNVFFCSEETTFVLSDQSKYVDWIFNLIADNDFECGDVSFIFCSDTYLLDLNKKHLGHNYYTDVITFDYTQEHNVSGDIFISVDRVGDNAKEFHCSFAEELRRVMAHGVLHLMGFDDKDPEAQGAMRRGENQALTMFK